jgi:hypothetical protein
MNNNVYITQELVGDIEHSEIDIDLHDQFGFDYETASNFITIERGQGQVDNTPININTLLESINDLKSRGATHISLSYHCDHIGYELSGYKITEADPAVIAEFEEAKRQKVEKAQKIMELRNQIAQLERGSVSTQDDHLDNLPF